MLDYTIFYKSVLPLSEPWDSEEWDLFISAWRPTDRTKLSYTRVVAAKKHWLVIPEYCIAPPDLPSEEFFALEGETEAEQIESYLAQASLDLKSAGKICIDITGFLRPHMMFLLMLMARQGIAKTDCLYAEPYYYIHRSQTKFSGEVVTHVRQVIGFEGIHNRDVSKDLLVIGCGYDDKLISYAAESRNKAKKVQIFGLPSLSPQMYQENVVRAYRASEAIGSAINSLRYAPANDPFATANVLRQIVEHEKGRAGGSITNLYLCPLSTLAQSLGFVIYYLSECMGSAASIISPFCESYPSLTGEGVQRVWKYTVELQSLLTFAT